MKVIEFPKFLHKEREVDLEGGGVSMNCKKCGEQDFKTTYLEPIKTEMINQSLCFDCHFWTQRVDNKNSPTQATIKGAVYQIARETGVKGEWKGFGGRKFRIRFFDGRVLETTNLWHNGKVPPHFRDELQDNAEFEEVQKGRINHGFGYYQDPTEGL